MKWQLDTLEPHCQATPGEKGPHRMPVSSICLLHVPSLGAPCPQFGGSMPSVWSILKRFWERYWCEAFDSRAARKRNWLIKHLGRRTNRHGTGKLVRWLVGSLVGSLVRFSPEARMAISHQRLAIKSPIHTHIEVIPSYGFRTCFPAPTQQYTPRQFGSASLRCEL